MKPTITESNPYLKESKISLNQSSTQLLESSLSWQERCISSQLSIRNHLQMTTKTDESDFDRNQQITFSDSGIILGDYEDSEEDMCRVVLILQQKNSESDLKKENHRRKLVSLPFEEITLEKIKDLFLGMIASGNRDSPHLSIYYIDSDGDCLPVASEEDLVIFLEQEKAMVLYAKPSPKINKEEGQKKGTNKTKINRRKTKEEKKTLKRSPSKMYLVQDPFTDFKILFQFLIENFNIQKNYEIGKLVYEKCGDQIADILIQATKEACSENEVAVEKGKERLVKFEEDKKEKEEQETRKQQIEEAMERHRRRGRRGRHYHKRTRRESRSPIISTEVDPKLKHQANSLMLQEDYSKKRKHHRKDYKYRHHHKHYKHKHHHKKNRYRKSHYFEDQGFEEDGYKRKKDFWKKYLPKWKQGSLKTKWVQFRRKSVAGGGQESYA